MFLKLDSGNIGNARTNWQVRKNDLTLPIAG